MDGTYMVTYTPPCAGEYRVSVEFLGTFQVGSHSFRTRVGAATHSSVDASISFLFHSSVELVQAYRYPLTLSMRLSINTISTGNCGAYLRVTVLVCMRGWLRPGEQHVQRPLNDVKH